MLRKNSPKSPAQKIWLPIEPDFLQQRLKFTRLALLGEISVGVVAASAGSLAVSSTHRYQARSHQRLLRRDWKQLVGSLLHGSVVAVALTAAVLWWGPGLWYRLSGETADSAYASVVRSAITLARSTGLPIKQLEENEQALSVTPVAGQSGQNETGVEQEPPLNQSLVPADSEIRQLPPINPNLPVGDWLIIPKIGVRSQLQATSNYEDALATGLWRAPDFGKPGSLELPMIVAGHRYGWKWWWKDEYWKYNSFNLLPELQVGDRVEVISEQRKWTYEIYAGAEGTEITDYDADLILYTCKYLQSPLRFFRYARLVEE